jgi:general secretion pathway protein K
MIIVTLVATLAAGMVWQQYRAVQIEAAERARAQSGWILQGALDWARLILREDDPKVDHLGEVWAVPLAEARLSTFLAADRSNTTDDGPEAFLSGTITDAQARYNLRNLLVADPKLRELEERVLERLCESAGVPGNTASTLAKAVRETFGTAEAAPGAASSASGAQLPANGNLQPANIDQLAWLGLSRDAIERLRPFLTLLPRPTSVNLNTAPREVIAALYDGLDLASAQRLVLARQGRPLQATEDAKPFLPNGVQIDPNRSNIQTSFFIVTGRLRLDERQLEQRSLVERKGREIVVLARERVSQILDSKR